MRVRSVARRRPERRIGRRGSLRQASDGPWMAVRARMLSRQRRSSACRPALGRERPGARPDRSERARRPRWPTDPRLSPLAPRLSACLLFPPCTVYDTSGATPPPQFRSCTTAAPGRGRSQGRRVPIHVSAQMNWVRAAIAILGGLLMLVTALPLVRSNEWWIRVWDFPRIQVAVLIGARPPRGPPDARSADGLRTWAFAAGLLLRSPISFCCIWPYTPLKATEVAVTASCAATSRSACSSRTS